MYFCGTYEPKFVPGERRDAPMGLPRLFVGYMFGHRLGHSNGQIHDVIVGLAYANL